MSKNTNLSFLTDFLTADIVNSRVGMNNVSPQATFDVTGTGKFSGILTLGSTVSNGTYTYTLPSSTGTLALTSDIPSVSGYVPYTGANQSVDLGNNVLTSRGLNIDSIGGTAGALNLRQATSFSTWSGAPFTSIYATTGNRVVFSFSNDNRSFTLDGSLVSAASPRTFTFPDATGTFALTSQIPTNAVGGTGTLNTIPKFTAATTIGNSNIFDSGSIIYNTNPAAGTFAWQFSGSTVTGQSYGAQVVAGTNASDIGFKVMNAAASINYLVVRGDGNVGIGTVSPSAGLEIETDGSVKTALRVTSNQAFNASPVTAIMFRYRISSGTTIGGAVINAAKDNATENSQAGNLQFWTNNGSTLAERMRIISDGSVQMNNIPNATIDTDRFLVSDSGVIKYRTGAELLSDIGAAPATGGSYLPLAGGTLTGALNGTSASFTGSVTSDDLILTAGTLFGTGNTGFSNRASDTTLYLQMPATGFNITDNGLNTRFTLTSAGAATFSGAGGRIVRIDGPSNTDNFLSLHSGSIEMFIDADFTNSSGIVGTQSSHNLILRTGGTNKVWITTAGNVGIGTNDPAAALNVSNVPTSFYGIIETTGTSAGTVKHFRVHKPGYVEYGIGILADNSFHISTASTFPTSNGFTMTSGGNVGIGTTSPKSFSNIRYLTLDGVGGSAVTFYKNGSEAGEIQNSNAGALTYANNVGHYFTGGSVVIGSAINDFGKLDITTSNSAGFTYALALGPRTNVSEGDSVGISFKSKISLSGAIWENARIAAVTESITSSIYGALAFYTMNATTLSEKMRISPTGIVTTPFQPAFRAGRNASYNPGPNSPIIFNSTSGFGFNIGGYYNTSNGRFTAPIAGVYNFTACVIWESLGSGQPMDDCFEIKVNGVTAAYSFRRAAYIANTTGIGGYYVDNATVLLNLSAGQYVEVVNRYNLTIHGNQSYCYFQGYLVG